MRPLDFGFTRKFLFNNQTVRFSRQGGLFLRLLIRTAFMSSAVLAFFGCSDVSFRKDPNVECQGSGPGACVTTSGSDSFDYNVRLSAGKVDLMFINDNSASMSWEQARIADRFGNFVQQLELSGIDYRIGMVTTDISSSSNPARSVNQNGGLQDGKLISFSPGLKFLSSNVLNLSERVSLFGSAIKRSETLSCESFIRSWRNAGKSIYSTEYEILYRESCPSGDERGTYAATLALRANENGFIRQDGSLVLVFVSDEDVRSQLYSPYGSGYDLEAEDHPETLISEAKSRYPNKKFVSHAIVTTDDCLSEQNNQIPGVISGSTGVVYDQLAKKTGGRTISICSSNYTSQLGIIADDIISKSREFTLKCNYPQTVVVSPSTVSFTISGSVIRFAENAPMNTDIRIQETCISR
jgi:hypothetical protein